MAKKHTNESIDLLLRNRTVRRIGEYCGSKTPITFKCLIDGHIWDARPDTILLSKNGCPKCCDSIKITNDRIDGIINDENIKVIRIGNYKNDKTKLLFKCKVCGYNWNSRWDVVRSCECPECDRNRQKLDISVVNSVLSSIGFNSIKETEYVNYYHKTKFTCSNNSDHVVVTDFASIRRYGSCPLCVGRGRSEEYIYKKLCEYFKSVERQKLLYFNNRKYFIDFYIPEINTYIEYNGIQHYKPVCFGRMSEEESIRLFELQIKRDNEVRKYIKENIGSKLIEIHYSSMWNKKNINRIIEDIK